MRKLLGFNARLRERRGERVRKVRALESKIIKKKNKPRHSAVRISSLRTTPLFRLFLLPIAGGFLPHRSFNVLLDYLFLSQGREKFIQGALRQRAEGRGKRDSQGGIHRRRPPGETRGLTVKRRMAQKVISAKGRYYGKND